MVAKAICLWRSPLLGAFLFVLLTSAALASPGEKKSELLQKVVYLKCDSGKKKAVFVSETSPGDVSKLSG